MLGVEVSGPQRLYDLLVTEEYGDNYDKKTLIEAALTAPFPRSIQGHPLDLSFEPRAQLVEPYLGWREEFEAQASGRGMANQGAGRTPAPLRWLGQPPQPNYTGNGRADPASSPVRLFPAGDSGRGTVGVARGPGGVRHTAHGAPPGLRPSPWPGAGDSPLREPTPLDRTTGPSPHSMSWH
jgi:hypothetical protein